MAQRPKERNRTPGLAGPPSHRCLSRKQTFIERNRSAILIAALGGGAIALLAAGLFLSRSATGHTSASPADFALVETVTNVPGSVLDAVGAGSATNPPAAINAPALTQDGKPEVLYVGGDFCPYCAAERWAMVVALSRFGTFTDLKTTRSASADVYPSTATFSFYGSSYRSDYIAFVPVEQYSNERTATGYATLQALTDDQQKLVNSYGNGIPFIDFGGKYVLSGASYNPGILGGLDWQGIASRLTQTNSTQSQAIVGTANVLSAAICRLTDGKPDNVCSAAGTQKGASLLR